MKKIITLEEYIEKNINKKFNNIVLAHGVFDLLHIGHLRYLRRAKALGDCLIVSITNDVNVNKGINRPFFNENLRLEAIAQLECVDFVILSNEKTSEKIIKKVKPKIYVKGIDYKKPEKSQLKNYKIELSALKRNGGKFKIIDDINFSSSNLINLNFDKLNFDQKQLLNKIIEKDKISVKKIESLNINEPILVFGDIIVDKFIFTKSLGKSRKNNIISTRYKKTEIYDGGSLMIAKILSNYFKNVSLLTFLNNNELKSLKSKFKKINFINVKNNNTGITYKTRFVDEYNLSKIFQLNENDEININKISEKKILSKILTLSKRFKKIVITDFGQGLITDNICSLINKIKKNKFINCQANSSNFGYNKFNKYNNAKILSCDEDEFRLSLNQNTLGLYDVIKKNINEFKKIHKMVVTSGKQGSYFIEKNEINFVKSLKINNMVDSIGCGDVFFSYLIVFNCHKNKNKLSNSEIMILCHLAASLHSKYFANSKLIDKEEYLKGFKSITA